MTARVQVAAACINARLGFDLSDLLAKAAKAGRSDAALMSMVAKMRTVERWCSANAPRLLSCRANDATSITPSPSPSGGSDGGGGSAAAAEAQLHATVVDMADWTGMG